MDKYQNELDKLKAWCLSFPESTLIMPQLDNSFGLLQEVINNYDELLDKFHRLNNSYAEACVERYRNERALEEACKGVVLLENGDQQDICVTDCPYKSSCNSAPCKVNEWDIEEWKDYYYERGKRQ